MEVTNDAQKIGAALDWIVSLLNRYHITYQIVGGLAAKAYGARGDWRITALYNLLFLSVLYDTLYS